MEHPDANDKGSASLIKTGLSEYAWTQNVSMKGQLRVYVRFHLLFALLRFLASSFEPDSSHIPGILLPYLFLSIVTLVCLCAYTSRLLHVSEEGQKRDARLQAGIRFRIQLAGGTICGLLFLDLAIVNSTETDHMIIMVNYVGVLLLVYLVGLRLIRSPPIVAIVTLLYLAVFWRGCMVHSEKPALLLLMMSMGMAVGMYAVCISSKEDEQVYLRAWCTAHFRALGEQFLAALDEPVMIVEKSRLLYANPVCADRLGVTEKNYVEKLRMFMRPNYRSLLEVVMEGLQDNDAFAIPEAEYRFSASPSSFFRVSVVATIFRDEHKSLALVFKPVPANDQAVVPIPGQTMRQLRSALCSIVGVLSLCKRMKEASGETKMRIAEASAAGRILANELALSGDHGQVRRGALALRRRRTNLRQLLKRAVRLAYLALGEKRAGTDVLLTESDNLIGEVFVDQGRVEEVLTAVLCNAVSRATGRGQIELKVWHNDEERMVEIAVSDASEAPVPPSRLSDTTGSSTANSYFSNRSEELLITTHLLPARELCQQMGGDLTLDSAISRLTVVGVRFPYDPPLANAVVGELEERRGTSPSLVPEMHFHQNSEVLSPGISKPREGQKARREVRMLVADDVELNRFALAQLLHKCGVDVTEAKDGEDATAKVREMLQVRDEPMLGLVAFLDIEMPPGMDGVETARKIRELCHSQHCKATMVAVTAHTDEAEVRRYMESGFDHFIPKPVRLWDIRQTLALVAGVEAK